MCIGSDFHHEDHVLRIPGEKLGDDLLDISTSSFHCSSTYRGREMPCGFNWDIPILSGRELQQKIIKRD
jgi:hypothetical protein